MEDETNLISSTTTYLTVGDCDSSSSNHLLPKKRNSHAREGKNCISGSRFKGVVGQQNGHWGAQIYANHQRIWLGTFKTETEAAMAYDSAAIRLLGQDHSHRNLSWTNSTILEPNFQTQFSTEDILRMIKEGSYASKFDEFLKEKFEDHFQSLKTLQTVTEGNAEFLCKQLFQKELTPSDVGKLNRLVIPKKYATKYFPQIQDEEMICYDTSKRLWKFRYCYWKSSQSFVFTKGWNKFVKDKSLRAKDTIVFNLCEFKNGTKENCNAFVIDVVKNIEGLPMDLALNHHQQEETIDDHEAETQEFTRAQSFNHDVDALVPVWLFGKQIGWIETKKGN
ncbi:AP2/ERF and B3 domain-containing transcription factor At1g51120-like [Solanum dulcamara]|uniref:AP2/ERF and B3 domain-containing transcription factor At1g51120-like n=1 Tax=Solanum dulcamara TaxID=45834 RepID=UPI0024864DC0|nr:AP2/ERF and B3 domain-containing transcription factor At1g51120-like [Solanum dulcamara]